MMRHPGQAGRAGGGQLRQELGIEHGAAREPEAGAARQMRMQHRQPIGIMQRQHQRGAVLRADLQIFCDRGGIGRERIPRQAHAAALPGAARGAGQQRQVGMDRGRAVMADHPHPAIRQPPNSGRSAFRARLTHPEAGRRPVSLEAGRIDHDGLRVPACGGQTVHDAGEHPLRLQPSQRLQSVAGAFAAPLAPRSPSTAGAVPSRSVSPSQAVAFDEDNAAEHAPVIAPRASVRL